MTRLSIAFFVLLILAAVPALADNTNTQNLGSDLTVSPGQVTPTPEMWFYEQYRRDREDPKLAVRRKAQFLAEQRRRRITAMKWFGFSNQRPQAGSDPYHGSYSPVWESNNGRYPFSWNGIGPSWVIVRPQGSWLANY